MITENIKKILTTLPSGVRLCAAAKTRNVTEIEETIEAGCPIIGMNYVQEAVSLYNSVKKKCAWHFIGHLQKNKVRDIVANFDMIESLDNIKLAEVIDRRALSFNKVMDVLIEVNSGREIAKNGVMPENVFDFILSLQGFKNISIKGLMTIGPFSSDADECRPYFSLTAKLFSELRELNQENVSMEILSMGMSDSYLTAISEGANIVRIGTAIFGERG